MSSPARSKVFAVFQYSPPRCEIWNAIVPSRGSLARQPVHLSDGRTLRRSRSVAQLNVGKGRASKGRRLTIPRWRSPLKLTTSGLDQEVEIPAKGRWFCFASNYRRWPTPPPCREKCPNPKKNRTLPRLKKMMSLWVVKVPSSGFSGCRKSACSGRLVIKNRYLHNDEKNHGDYRYKSERHAYAQQ